MAVDYRDPLRGLAEGAQTGMEGIASGLLRAREERLRQGDITRVERQRQGDIERERANVMDGLARNQAQIALTQVQSTLSELDRNRPTEADDLTEYNSLRSALLQYADQMTAVLRADDGRAWTAWMAASNGQVPIQRAGETLTMAIPGREGEVTKGGQPATTMVSMPALVGVASGFGAAAAKDDEARRQARVANGERVAEQYGWLTNIDWADPVILEKVQNAIDSLDILEALEVNPEMRPMQEGLRGFAVAVAQRIVDGDTGGTTPSARLRGAAERLLIANSDEAAARAREAGANATLAEAQANRADEIVAVAIGLPQAQMAALHAAADLDVARRSSEVAGLGLIAARIGLTGAEAARARADAEAAAATARRTAVETDGFRFSAVTDAITYWEETGILDTSTEIGQDAYESIMGRPGMTEDRFEDQANDSYIAYLGDLRQKQKAVEIANDEARSRIVVNNAAAVNYNAQSALSQAQVDEIFADIDLKKTAEARAAYWDNRDRDLAAIADSESAVERGTRALTLARDAMLSGDLVMLYRIRDDLVRDTDDAAYWREGGLTPENINAYIAEAQQNDDLRQEANRFAARELESAFAALARGDSIGQMQFGQQLYAAAAAGLTVAELNDWWDKLTPNERDAVNRVGGKKSLEQIIRVNEVTRGEPLRAEAMNRAMGLLRFDFVNTSPAAREGAVEQARLILAEVYGDEWANSWAQGALGAANEAQRQWEWDLVIDDLERASLDAEAEAALAQAAYHNAQANVVGYVAQADVALRRAQANLAADQGNLARVEAGLAPLLANARIAVDESIAALNTANAGQVANLAAATIAVQNSIAALNDANAAEVPGLAETLQALQQAQTALASAQAAEVPANAAADRTASAAQSAYYNWMAAGGGQSGGITSQDVPDMLLDIAKAYQAQGEAARATMATLRARQTDLGCLVTTVTAGTTVLAPNPAMVQGHANYAQCQAVATSLLEAQFALNQANVWQQALTDAAMMTTATTTGLAGDLTGLPTAEETGGVETDESPVFTTPEIPFPAAPPVPVAPTSASPGSSSIPSADLETWRRAAQNWMPNDPEARGDPNALLAALNAVLDQTPVGDDEVGLGGEGTYYNRYVTGADNVNRLMVARAVTSALGESIDRDQIKRLIDLVVRYRGDGR